MGRTASYVVAALVMLVLCASTETHAALRIYNGIEGKAITVRQPPGCCSYCTGKICPAVCETCKDVVIESRKEVKLEPRVGPYPLERLQIQVPGADIYCVPEEALKYLTATAQLRVGPGDCNKKFPPDIKTAVVDGSDRFDTCLRLCDQRQNS